MDYTTELENKVKELTLQLETEKFNAKHHEEITTVVEKNLQAYKEALAEANETTCIWKKRYNDLSAHINSINTQNAELVSQVKKLKNDLRQTKLIHIGFTNESQVHYVTEDKEEGSFYPDSDNGCYIPVYMLNIHAHRVGPDSAIYCTQIEQSKKISELERHNAELVAQVEMLRAALEATRQPHMDYIPKLDKTARQVLDATPAQCLRQIQADAVLEFAKQYKNKYEMLPATASPTVVSFANEYAERVKAGEASEANECEIQNAVMFLGGIWPQSQWSSDRFIYLVRHPNGGNGYATTDSKDNPNYNYVCTRKQFEQVAAKWQGGE